MDWRDHITVDHRVCHGRACIRGTRVPVSVVIDNLADGETPEEIVRGYHITLDDVRAALHYAAELAHERHIAPPVTSG